MLRILFIRQCTLIIVLFYLSIEADLDGDGMINYEGELNFLIKI